MSSLKALVAGLAGAALIGCAPAKHRSPAPEAASAPADRLHAGIYEAAHPSHPKLHISLFLSPAHGFILRQALGKEILAEFRGRWSSDADSLRLRVFDARRPREPGAALRTQRLDSAISCPIHYGGGAPLPLLRLATPEGFRLVQLVKPPDAIGAWEGDLVLGSAPKAANGKTAKHDKSEKGGRAAAKPGKGRNGKVAVAPAGAGEIPAAPADAKSAVPES